MPAPKKVALFSKEYPPFVYGGAGVHVEYLARALAKSIDVEVRCFGDQQVDRSAARGPRLSAMGGDTTGHRSALRRRDRRLRAFARHGQGHDRRRSCSLPHVVHRHGRRDRLEAVGRAKRFDHPLARAAAALEGGAARQCLSPVGLDGAHRHHGGRRHRGRVARDEGRRATPVRRRSGAGACHPQRHRSRRIPCCAPAPTS